MLLCNDPLLWMFRNRNSRFYACGHNDCGQIGDGTQLDSTTLVPVEVPALDMMTAGNGGTAKSCAGCVGIDGSFWRWGYRGKGWIGDGFYSSDTDSDYYRLSPYCSGERRYRRAVIGDQDMYAIGLNDGFLYHCGSDPDNRSLSLFSSHAYAEVFGKSNNFMAIDTAGHLWGWGLNSMGELGADPSTVTKITTPQQIGTKTWKSAALAANHVLLLDSDNYLWAMGTNHQYSFLNGVCEYNNHHTAPVQAGSKKWKYISVGKIYISLGIDEDGHLWTNYDIASGDYAAPQQIGTKTWRMVCCGQIVSPEKFFFAAIDTDNDLWTWGDNTYGQLGDGTTVSKSEPQKIGSRKWKYVAASAGTLYAIPL